MSGYDAVEGSSTGTLGAQAVRLHRAYNLPPRLPGVIADAENCQIKTGENIRLCDAEGNANPNRDIRYQWRVIYGEATIQPSPIVWLGILHYSLNEIILPIQSPILAMRVRDCCISGLPNFRALTLCRETCPRPAAST
jgi:hypothetical protein